MSTATERLIVMETEVSAIKADVAEIKADVKTLLLANAGSVGGVALTSRVIPWLAVAVAVIALITN